MGYVCVGYVWNGYVWDMCNVLDMCGICVVDTFEMDMCGICKMCWICVGYVWCEIRQQSSEEPCDETSFGKKTLRKDGWNRMPHYYAKCLICLTLAVLRRFSKHLHTCSPFPIFLHGLQKKSPRMIQPFSVSPKGRIVTKRVTHHKHQDSKFDR